MACSKTIKCHVTFVWKKCTDLKNENAKTGLQDTSLDEKA